MMVNQFLLVRVWACLHATGVKLGLVHDKVGVGEVGVGGVGVVGAGGGEFDFLIAGKKSSTGLLLYRCSTPDGDITRTSTLACVAS